MTSSHADLLRSAYTAFNERDVEAGVALMDPNVKWPNITDGGFVHGRDEVRAHWREQFGQVDPRIELGKVSTRSDGRVQAHVRQIVRALDGTKLSDDELTHVFTMTNDLIMRMDVEPSASAPDAPA